MPLSQSPIDQRLRALGIVLPKPTLVPPGARLPFAFVNVRGDRAWVSGHGPVDADGRLAGPFGLVGQVGQHAGAQVTPQQAHASARLVGLAMLASLQAELGSLDRVAGWGGVFGMVAAAPGFTDLPAVINGCSDLILQVFGDDIGRHARSAVGMACLPWSIPVEIEAEVLLHPPARSSG